MLRASSAHLQEGTVVYMQHMILSLCMRVPGGLSVHSLSEFSLANTHFGASNVRPVIFDQLIPKTATVFPYKL